MGSIVDPRGQAAFELGSKRITWDIISNIWQPKTNPSGFLSIGMAENTLLHDTLLKYIRDNFRPSAELLTYNNGSMGSNKPHHVLMANGCFSAIEQLSWTFLKPGEAVLLGQPYYSTRIAYLTLRPEAVVVPVEMGIIDTLSPEAVGEYEKAAMRFEERTGKRVRAVMLSNPHNPLGRCLPHATIDGLMSLCQARKMHLISDEIYVLSVWHNRVDRGPSSVPFESVLSIDTIDLIDPSVVHVLWGMSKDFGANGLRVGAIISQSSPALHTAQKCLSLYSFVSGLSDQITASIFQNDAVTDRYIKSNQTKLSECHEFITQLLDKHGIEYSHGCNAGFFVWVNLGQKYREAHPGEDDESLTFTDIILQRLLDNRVYSAHGTAYGSEHPG
ncbi:PLP-dependent transferase [Aspergillus steynii IBT 23096]|uniref:PLP-dependent transferase n=1 Tax=Aspergillus steynii IBT 23096 TaxID=1392250 RepID=A0A2I2FRX7_9EURO|nr:PLP-dependent transferase [Aspergillus steynii IBT 23096]PLB43384.1 PLP-dependent transferase [Aspergillus steynii IBT 23096]